MITDLRHYGQLFSGIYLEQGKDMVSAMSKCYWFMAIMVGMSIFGIVDFAINTDLRVPEILLLLLMYVVMLLVYWLSYARKVSTLAKASMPILGFSFGLYLLVMWTGARYLADLIFYIGIGIGGAVMCYYLQLYGKKR